MKRGIRVKKRYMKIEEMNCPKNIRKASKNHPTKHSNPPANPAQVNPALVGHPHHPTISKNPSQAKPTKVIPTDKKLPINPGILNNKDTSAVKIVMRDLTGMIGTDIVKERSKRQVIETLIGRRDIIGLVIWRIIVIGEGTKGMRLDLEKVREMVSTMIGNTKTTVNTTKETRGMVTAKKTITMHTNESTQESSHENTPIMTTATQEGTMNPKGMKTRENKNSQDIEIAKKTITKERVINRRKQLVRSGSTRSIWSRKSQRVIQRGTKMGTGITERKDIMRRK
jgi:hypothetical protein